MYVYMKPAEKAVEDFLACCPQIDPRIAAYLQGRIRTAMKRSLVLTRPIMFSDQAGKWLNQPDLYTVTWADAPETMRQALMNGEELMTVPYELAMRYVSEAFKHLQVKLKASAKAAAARSLKDYSPEVLANEYASHKVKVQLVRQHREARRGQVVLHTHRVNPNHVVEFVQILNAAALDLVGKALHNCLRWDYERGTKRTDRTGYVAFRSVIDGHSKWTSLASHDLLEENSLHFRALDHNALMNDDDNMLPLDEEIWEKRFCAGEFNSAIYTNHREFILNQTQRNEKLHLLFYKGPKVLLDILDMYKDFQSQDRALRGGVNRAPANITAFAATYGLGRRFGKTTMTHESLFEQLVRQGQTVTGRMSSQRTIAPEFLRSDFVRRFGHPGLGLNRAQAQIDTYARMYGMRRVAAEPEERRESEDEVKVWANNAASKLSQRTTTQLEVRQAQRNLQQKQVSPLWARMMGGVNPNLDKFFD